jgi:outer membrane protein assembly factor BamB
MSNAKLRRGVLGACVLLLGASCVAAQDWPQWRGPNREARATGFKAPATWPKELTQKWKVTVGDGVATPALVGDKLYVFSRQEGKEVLRCLDAANGKELWQDRYAADAPRGPSSRFPGPRASPAVAADKVVTLGASGALSCFDTAGKKEWRKEFKGVPRFFTSCSPLLVDGLAIVQVGGERSGGIAAYELASGNEKWKWSGDGTAYASPVLLTLGGTKVSVAETAGNIVAVGVADGKLLWKTPFAVRGRRGYNACTPVLAGHDTIVYSGSDRGTTAVQLEKKGDKVTAKELWSNSENSVQFNSPVVANGLVFGISARDQLFCINAKSGKTAWTTPLRGGRGYGSIVAAGSVLFALNPSGRLVVFEPTDKGFKQLASYKVADGGTYAYPVVAGNRVFVKDSNSLTLWTID